MNRSRCRAGFLALGLGLCRRSCRLHVRATAAVASAREPQAAASSNLSTVFELKPRATQRRPTAMSSTW